jgi:hypothetical protein
VVALVAFPSGESGCASGPRPDGRRRALGLRTGRRPHPPLAQRLAFCHDVWLQPAACPLAGPLWMPVGFQRTRRASGNVLGFATHQSGPAALLPMWSGPRPGASWRRGANTMGTIERPYNFCAPCGRDSFPVAGRMFELSSLPRGHGGPVSWPSCQGSPRVSTLGDPPSYVLAITILLLPHRPCASSSGEGPRLGQSRGWRG